MKEIILTGDRPTGKLHIGHYFGSLSTRLETQNKYDQYIMIADVQALTDNFDNPSILKNSIRELMIDYLSVGLDPNKNTFFIQSKIPEIAELTVFYSNLVTVSRLKRNPTVKNEIEMKEKLFKDGMESVTYGFLGYPVSQAADITVVNAKYVPVGEDQLPMIEQTREIVRKFNGIYGETFNEPEAILSKVLRLKGLDGNKMGKSLNNGIYLSDAAEIVNAKVMKAKTDPDKLGKNDPANPDKCMVAYYHQIFTKEYDDVCGECTKGLRGCVDCKKQLAENINTFLNPIREKRAELEKNPAYLEDLLQKGYTRVKETAEEQMKTVRKVMQIDY